MAEAPPYVVQPIYQDEDPIPLYGVPDVDYLSQGDERKEQTFTTYIKELNNLIHKFGGREHEDVSKFIMSVDQAMINCKMTSKQVMVALRSQNSPIYDRAAQFLNLTLQNARYPHSDHWCEQRYRQGRPRVAWQAQVDEVLETESIASVESLAESIATLASINTVGEPEGAGHVAGVHGLENRRADPRTARQHARHHQDHTPHQDHIPFSPEIPDQNPIQTLQEIPQTQCMRHYLYYEFKTETDIATANKTLNAAQFQTRTTSVREFIWKLQLAHREYKKARWGFRANEMIEKNRESDEDNMCNAIKNNTVNEFKKFIESKLTSDKNCMNTLAKCEKMARIFEEMTEEGRTFSAKCRSAAKVEQVMALKIDQSQDPSAHSLETDKKETASSYEYNAAYFSDQQAQISQLQQNLKQAQQKLTSSQQRPQLQWQDQARFVAPPPIQTPPMPDHLLGQMSEDQWKTAYFAASTQHQISAANIGNMQSQTSQRGVRGGTSRRPGNRGTRGGNRGNRGRGGGGGRGGTQQPPRPPPPPNVIPPNFSDYWALSQKQEQDCLHPNPQGLPRCGYCGVAGHGYSQCGYKREDLANGKSWNTHPKRGQLLSKKRTFAHYMRAQRQNVANSAAMVSFTDFTLQAQQQQQQQQPPDNPGATTAADATAQAEMQQQIAAMAAQLATIQQQQHNVAAATTFGFGDLPKARLPSTMPPLLPPLPPAKRNTAGAGTVPQEPPRQSTEEAQGGAPLHPVRPPSQNSEPRMAPRPPPPMTPQEIQFHFQNWVDQQTASRLHLQNQTHETMKEEDFYM